MLKERLKMKDNVCAKISVKETNKFLSWHNFGIIIAVAAAVKALINLL